MNSLGINVLSPNLTTNLSGVSVGTPRLAFRQFKYHTSFGGVMIVISEHIAVGSTPLIKVSLVDGKQIYLADKVLYRVQAKKSLTEWDNVGDLSSVENPQSQFDIILSPEQTSSVDWAIDNKRRLVIQVFYSSENRTGLSNIISVEFELESLPVLADEYKVTLPELEFTSTEPQESSIGINKFSVSLNRPIKSYSLNLYDDLEEEGASVEVPCDHVLQAGATEIQVFYRDTATRMVLVVETIFGETSTFEHVLQ